MNPKVIQERYRNPNTRCPRAYLGKNSTYARMVSTNRSAKKMKNPTINTADIVRQKGTPPLGSSSRGMMNDTSSGSHCCHGQLSRTVTSHMCQRRECRGVY
eukprot:1371789-Amorphochlora_amoeboformis.AAC.1